MAALNRRTVHTLSNFHWMKLTDACPDLTLKFGGDGADEEPMALVFIDPEDNETHIYPFLEAGRKDLVRVLSGGIVVANGKLL